MKDVWLPLQKEVKHRLTNRSVAKEVIVTVKSQGEWQTTLLHRNAVLALLLPFVFRFKGPGSQWSKTMREKFLEKKSDMLDLNEAIRNECFVPLVNAPFRAPIENGVVVIDYDTKRMVGCQNKVNLARWPAQAVFNDKQREGVMLLRLIESGVVDSLATFENWKKQLSNEWYEKPSASVPLDWDGWEPTLSSDCFSAIEALETLLHQEVPLTAVELEAWGTWDGYHPSVREEVPLVLAQARSDALEARFASVGIEGSSIPKRCRL